MVQDAVFFAPKLYAGTAIGRKTVNAKVSATQFDTVSLKYCDTFFSFLISIFGYCFCMVLCLYRQSVTKAFAFVSLYELFSWYCADNGVELDSLLADGLHPNNNGYDVMYSLLVKAFEV